MRRFFVARGRVQGVMFRQTLIRGAQNRRLQAGASNLPNGVEVAFTLEGEAEAIAELVEVLRTRQPLNSWGACAECLLEQDDGAPVEAHQVHTGNVDGFSWNPNIAMYL
jgi:acylphosphatase